MSMRPSLAPRLAPADAPTEPNPWAPTSATPPGAAVEVAGRAVLPYGRQSIEADDVAAIVEAAQAPFITQGPQVAAFERALAEWCGAPYAVAVSSGTAALHLAALAAGVTPGQVSLTSPLTFVASANAALYCGGTPRFSDVEAATGNLDVDLLMRALRRHPSPRLVVPVHYAGLPANMPAIGALCREAGAMVVEDACHALGARYRSVDADGRERWHRVGACDHSDMTCFSFHPVKHITTGEGGAITTRNEALYRRLLSLRSHGIVREPGELRGRDEDQGPWYYEMQSLGFNYRITDLQCALGRSQLKKLPEFLERRREVAARYGEALGGIDGLVLPAVPEGSEHAFHLYAVRVDEERLKRRRRAIFEALRGAGLGVQVHYLPIHLQPYYRERFATHPGQFPEAERFYRREISLPMFPGMSDADVARVVEAVRAAVRR